jgi:hypothetical protein
MLALAVALPAAAGCGDGGEADSERSTTQSGTGTAGSAATDACSLLEDGEVAARVGGAARAVPRTGDTLDGFPLSQCEWKGPDGRVTVVVIASPKRFEMHADRGLGEPVRGLGDGALVEQGTSLESRGGTSGRTVFVLHGDRTLVVALDRGRQEEVATDEIVEVARSAHGNLD